ncbi:MAG: hypothetical protein RLZZ511_4187 [Cyanobacteriota bacterium]
MARSRLADALMGFSVAVRRVAVFWGGNGSRFIFVYTENQAHFDRRINGSVMGMSDDFEFSFAVARQITPEEVAAAKAAVKAQFGIEPGKRGRPPKPGELKYEAVSIRLNPQVLQWAKAEGERRGVGYQTVINEELLRLAQG